MFSLCLCVECPSVTLLARKNHVIISTAQRERVAKRATDPLCYLFNTQVLVALTLERFISICFPTHRTSWCTVAISKRIFAVISIFMFIVNGHVFWARGREFDFDVKINMTVLVSECGYTSKFAQ